jgi:hypothetical protein
VIWNTIESCPTNKTVLLYRSGDLYPVVGWKQYSKGSPWFMLEEGGPEDGEHRKYPFLHVVPTHWAELPVLPQ